MPQPSPQTRARTTTNTSFSPQAGGRTRTHLGHSHVGLVPTLELPPGARSHPAASQDLVGAEATEGSPPPSSTGQGTPHPHPHPRSHRSPPALTGCWRLPPELGLLLSPFIPT